MDAKNLAGITEQLEKERTALSTKADRLRTDLAGIESDLKRVSAAIAALTGHAEPTPSKKASSGTTKKSGKKAAGKADVIRMIHSVLSEDAVLEAAELKARIEKLLAKEGFSRLGFALRFKEAISDSQFVDTPGGIRLSEAKELVH